MAPTRIETAPSHPLAETVAVVDALNEWLSVRLDWPEDRTGWVGCAAVDADFIADWEARIDPQVRRMYGRTHPMAVSGFALDWYAAMAGVVGGACFRQGRRVPRLDRAALAFRCHPEEQYPEAVALLDPRFWCLSDDPAAGHRDADAVPDETALAAVLRGQVRAHADDFLAGYAGGAKLARRHRLGAFFDGLDTGVWYGGAAEAGAAREVLRLGALVLPGATPEFSERSTVYPLTDARGRDHLSRRRVGCCYYYKVTARRGLCHLPPGQRRGAGGALCGVRVGITAARSTSAGRARMIHSGESGHSGPPAKSAQLSTIFRPAADNPAVIASQDGNRRVSVVVQIRSP